MAGHRKEPRPSSKSKPQSRPTAGDRPKERTSREPADKKTSRNPEKRRSPSHEKRPSKTGASAKESAYTHSQTSSNVLSIDSLAKLNAANEKVALGRREAEARVHRKERLVVEKVEKEKVKHRRKEAGAERKKRRIVSGAILEEGRARRGGYIKEDDGRRERYSTDEDGRFGRRCWLLTGVVVLLLVILIPVGVLVVGKQGGGGGMASTPKDVPAPINSNLNGISENDIPTAAKGSYLDPFTWYDTMDFNVTYTADTLGGLPLMGLNSTWDDTAKANPYVPALNETWLYGTMPIRGINVGGWLSLEPFITPSLFNYQSNLKIVDEYSLTQHLGPSQAAKTLEKHYSSFINEQSFVEIQAAGFDHVRIPYSYWAITTYPGDPYVAKISWRYLLRGIEYARKYGLRVNLDLHGAPGSQNGWNHSGRQGVIGWLNGTDGNLNAQRTLDLHDQISTFFAQPRYKNVIAIYGLVNEPKMTKLPVEPVLSWTTSAIQIVRKNGIQQTIAFGDGFLGIPNWQGKLQGIDNLVMDAHQYVIFNVDQIAFSHQKKISFACSGWSAQMRQSTNVATG